jgi:hypothetical protein
MVMDVGGARVSLRRSGHTKQIELNGIGWLDSGSLHVSPDDQVEENEQPVVDEHDLAAIAEARMQASKPLLKRRKEFIALGELCDAVDLVAGSRGWIGTTPRTFRFPCDW